MRHDQITFVLSNGAIFSIVCLDGKRHEVAVMNDDGFVLVGEWYPLARDLGIGGDEVMYISGFANRLAEVLSRAQDWASHQVLSATVKGWE